MKDLPKNVLKDKSYAFALRTVNLYKHLCASEREYVLSKQMLRSGTSIGANIAGANQAQSRADFVSKLGIGLKEAVEREYWLNLLCDAGFLTRKQADSMLFDCIELIKLLTASIKTSRRATPS